MTVISKPVLLRVGLYLWPSNEQLVCLVLNGYRVIRTLRMLMTRKSLNRHEQQSERAWCSSREPFWKRHLLTTRTRTWKVMRWTSIQSLKGRMAGKDRSFCNRGVLDYPPNLWWCWGRQSPVASIYNVHRALWTPLYDIGERCSTDISQYVRLTQYRCR